MLTDRAAISRSFFGFSRFLLLSVGALSTCLVLLAYLSSQRKLYSIKSAKRRALSFCIDDDASDEDHHHNHADVDEQIIAAK